MTEATTSASPDPVATRNPAAPHSPSEPEPLAVRTEFSFTLPRGYVDGEGGVHREGVMRLATARDELMPLKDQRVQENPAYLSVVLLGRLIPRLGTVTDVHAGVIEGLFAADLAFLQRFYEKINSDGTSLATTACPECSHEFHVDLGSGLGE
ncbi:hypothetical protein [Streptomyces kronopolitis]|uniref:hypothetical protein n=1 Tax=Streptomyces kronopolitis TaxID=1612435 RepID=UPI0020BDE3C7|nr:hypothetical protein [Streptomyces kronopolitis]MCL6302584.1 hypothetical protein [Streptomyces kronopolitis]